ESLDLAMPPQLGGQVAQAPGDIAIAATGRDGAVLRVDQGAARLHQARTVVEPAAGPGLLHHVLDVLSRRVMVIDVEMPTVDVRIDDVIVVAWGVVLDEPSGVEIADRLDHVADPLLGVAVLLVIRLLAQAP